MSLAALLAELVPGLVASALDVVERDPKLAARVRALVAPLEHAGPAAFLSRSHFAERADIAPRTLDKLLSRGLPSIGTGKLLRIPVAQADLWLAAHLGSTDDAGALSDEDLDIERAATENARRRSA